MQTSTRSDLEQNRPYLSCVALALAAIASSAAAQDAPPVQPCSPCAEEKGAPSEGAGMFLIGATWLDLSSLNERLAANGYDKVTGAMVMIGGEGHAVFESGFVAGGRGAAILGPKGDGPDDLQTEFGGGYGLVDLGFAFVHTPAMLLTLTGGIGGYGMSLRIGEDQNVRFDDVLKNPRRGTTLIYGGVLAGATIGFDGRVPIGKVDEHGRRGFFTLGARRWAVRSGAQRLGLARWLGREARSTRGSDRRVRRARDRFRRRPGGRQPTLRCLAEREATRAEFVSRIMDTSHDPRPIELRLIGLGHRVVHRLSGGRFGQLDRGAQAPRGRVLQLITIVHRRLYIWTNGRVGAVAGGMPTLLLTTIGRKSGLPRTVPLPYFPHPDGYVIVGSYAGGPRNPFWYDNLVAQPQVELQIRERRVRAIAAAASPSERPGIWSQLLAIAPMYADYQRIAPREIPLVVLREIDS